MKPLFSVVVPIYDKEEYICECIDSILNQSFSNFELILVDDGSTDNCPSICDDYKNKDNRIRIIHKSNGGLVSARKEGTKIAKGEYIVCVDADDYIKVDYLNNIAIEIEKNHPDVVCTGHIRLEGKEEKSIKINYRNGYYSKQDIINEIYHSLIQKSDTTHFPVNIWSKAYKRKLYSKIQLNVDETVKIGEDGVVSLPFIYLANSISIIDDCEYVYRINNKSMTSNIAVLDPYYPKKAYYEFIKYIDPKEYDFEAQFNRFLVHQIFSMAVSQFNKEKSYKNTKQEILTILQDELYKKAINNAFFSCTNGNVIKYILEKKHIFIAYLISKLY